MRRTIGALASGLALAATLSACGGDPEPRFQEEPSVAPSTGSPSASAEPEPTEDTPEGAMAFVEYWLEQFNNAVASGETQALAGLSTDECSSCNSLIDLIDETYEAGGSIDGADWQLRNLAFSTPDEGKTVGVGGTMLIPKQTIVRPGEETETSAPLRARYFFTVERRADGWVVTAIATQS